MNNFAIRVSLLILLSILLSLMIGGVGCAHRNTATQSYPYPQAAKRDGNYPYLFAPKGSQPQLHAQKAQQQQQLQQQDFQQQEFPQQPMRMSVLQENIPLDARQQSHYFQQYSPQQQPAEHDFSQSYPQPPYSQPYSPPPQSSQQYLSPQYSPRKYTAPYLFRGSRDKKSSILQVSANTPYENQRTISLAAGSGALPNGPMSTDEFFEQGFSGQNLSGNDGTDFFDDLQFSFAQPSQREAGANRQIVRENMVRNPVSQNEIPYSGTFSNAPQNGPQSSLYGYSQQYAQRYAQQYSQRNSQDLNAEQYPWDRQPWDQQYSSNQGLWNQGMPQQPQWLQRFLESFPWSRRNRELRQQHSAQLQSAQQRQNATEPLPQPYQRFLLTNNGIGETLQKLRPGTAAQNVAHSKFASAVSSEYKPLTNRNWIANHARQATADIGEEQVFVQNIRNTSYRTVTDYTTSYFDATYSLSDLHSLYLIETPFKGMPSIAHVEVSFGFADGNYLGVSVEARYERGESYDPLGGLFNQFELIYVVANEQDIIRINTDINQNDVYLYRLDLSQEEVRAIFVDIMQRANKLSQEPEFYHTVSNNCTSNIIDHINRARPKAIPFEYRAVFPGYLDHLLYDLKLIDTKETSFSEARKKAKINDLAQKFRHSEFFSAGIRQNLY